MKIFRSAFVITFFSIIARILGFIRDSLIAQVSGVGFMSDVFFASFKITNFFRKILAEGTFFAAFVPSFTRILNENGKLALSNFASNVFSIMLYFVILITIICEIFMEPIIAFTSPGFLPDKAKFLLTVELSRILFSYFILIVCCSILCGLLNSIKKFSYYAIVPVFLNVSLIAFICFFQNSFKTFAHALTFGVLIGGLMQFLFAYLGCVIEGFKIRIVAPTKSMFQKEVIQTFKKMFPAMVAGGLTQINTLLDLILGSLIVSGVSYLYFVDRIFYLPTASIGTALGIVVLPMLSTAVGKKSIFEVRKIQTRSLNIGSLLVIPVSISLILFSDVFVSILFERGNFSNENTQVVAKCLSILGFALPFVVYSKILSAIFFSNGNTKTPMFITLFCAIINVVFSIVLLKFYGIYGIIIGSTLSYFFDALITFILLYKNKFIGLHYKMIAVFNIKIIISSICFGLFCFYFFSINSKTSYYANIFEYSILIKFFYLSAIGLIALTLYVLMLKLLGINAKKVLR